MSLISEIQNEILSEKPVSTILRKAKVLAYSLKNQEFKDWIEFELNGYKGERANPLPDYRNFRSPIFGDFINLAWKNSNAPIPLSVFPESLQEMISTVEMREGVKELESMLEKSNASSDTQGYRYLLPVELIPSLHSTVYENMGCLGAWRTISCNQIAQILDTIRNRLLSFILELSERYPEYVNSDFENNNTIPTDQIRQVFNFYIMGNNPKIVGSSSKTLQGGAVSIFDQRNQKVEYQYNAARDINLDAVKSREEFSSELEKLKLELRIASEAQVVGTKIVNDIENKIIDTIEQSKKPQPDKKKMVDNINGAIAILKGITAAAGLVSAFVKAVELINKFF